MGWWLILCFCVLVLVCCCRFGICVVNWVGSLLWVCFGVGFGWCLYCCGCMCCGVVGCCVGWGRRL